MLELDEFVIIIWRIIKGEYIALCENERMNVSPPLNAMSADWGLEDRGV